MSMSTYTYHYLYRCILVKVSLCSPAGLKLRDTSASVLLSGGGACKTPPAGFNVQWPSTREAAVPWEEQSKKLRRRTGSGALLFCPTEVPPTRSHKLGELRSPQILLLSDC